MKKQYIKPMTDIATAMLEQVIAQSVTGTITDEEYSGPAGIKGRGREIDDENVKNGWTDGLW